MNNYKKTKIAFTWPNGPIPDEIEDLEASLEELILTATDSIDILTYTYQHDFKFILNQALDEIYRNNKVNKIRFFLDGKGDAKKITGRYKGSGVNVECWYWQNPSNEYSKFHIKSILVDKFNVYLGTANWGHTALEQSAECGLLFTSREITVSIKKYLEKLIDEGLLIKYES